MISPSVISFFIAAVFCSSIAYAQQGIKIDKEQEDSLQTQAKRMAETMITLDAHTIIKYSYPGIVDRFWEGEEKLPALMKNMKKEMEDMDFNIISIKIGEHTEIVKAKDEIYTFINQTSVGTVKQDTIISNSCLLAISGDSGNNWRFIDCSYIYGTEDIQTLYPNYNSLLPLPPFQPPTMKSKQ